MRATVGVAVQAGLAAPTRNGRVDGDARPNRWTLDPRTECGDLAGEFVAKREGQRRHRVADMPVHVVVHIRAAHADGAHANESFTRPGLRSGDIVDPQIAGCIESQCFHGSS
jgi:hypothetical protein